MREKILWQRLIQIYIILIPFLSAFAVSPLLPLPLLFISSIFLILFGKFIDSKIFWLRDDIDIFVIIALGVGTMIFSWQYLGQKNINHLAAISVSIFFFYFVVRVLLQCLDSFQGLSRAFVFSLFIVSGFVIFEFIASNYFNIHVPSIIPYSFPPDAPDALIFGTFIRPRGLAEEAGFMSMFYELALPMSFIYLKNLPFLAIAYYAMVALPSFLLLGSGAGVASFLMAIIIVCLINIKQKWFLYILLFLCLAIMVVLSFEAGRLYFHQVVGRRLEFFLFDPMQQTASTARIRTEVYFKMFNLFLAAPWGIGWGTASQIYSEGWEYSGIVLDKPSFISFYSEILIASGFLGLLFFMKFIYKKIVKLIYIKTIEAQLVLISLISICLHYLFISNYWMPMLWFSLAMTDVLIRRRKKENKLKCKPII
ncbi:MAG: O-antigen ligase family protein [Coleofasciculus sp. A1-SPW-01]|uniref:O-antigen ligase family protein n=1 Tax=Coleofasciculus sp. A1-SPW-01 TaxID=3070819 RepID=UPI0033008A58